jgi:hypothetical protein
MDNNPSLISVRSAALISGFSLLVLVLIAPFAELYVLPKIIVPYNAIDTAKNILAHERLFVVGIFAYLVTFIVDIVLAWSLYIFFKPVNKYLSLLTGLFRLVYSILALVALSNLVTAFKLVTNTNYLKILDQKPVYDLAMIHILTFKSHWYFGIIIFAIHLLMLAYLIFRSGFVPRFVAVFVAISGMGYLLTSIKPYFFPHINLDFAMYTFFGEIVFMIWLLIRGWKLPKDKIN